MRINFETIHFHDLKIIVAATQKGVLEIALRSGESQFLSSLKKNYPDCEIERGKTPLLEKALGQLGKYFSGKLREFDIPLDLRVTPFQKNVLDAVAKIPFGKTMSYGDIARKIGNPKAARAVGGAVGANPIPIIIPCHRVLAAGGKIGGFGGGIDLKIILLDIERIIR